MKAASGENFSDFSYGLQATAEGKSRQELKAACHIHSQEQGERIHACPLMLAPSWHCVTCCGLCPPTSINIIKTSLYRHPHRQNCSRQALLETLFPGDMMLCQVDKLIKMSHHTKCTHEVCFISKHSSIPYPAGLGQKSFIRFWIFLVCAIFACI